MTKTKKKQYEIALKKLNKCSGDCKHCNKCHVYTSAWNRDSCYYAFGCDLLPVTDFDYISSTMRNLHATAIDTIKFELGV